MRPLITATLIASVLRAPAVYAQPLDGLPPSIPTAPSVPGSPSAPFGPGALVQVTSGGAPMTVYVARVPIGATQAPLESDFVKLGKTPIEFQLPPGSYQIEAEGHGKSHEALLFEMHSQPRRLLVQPGDEGLGVVGTLFLGVGITAVLAATAILVSGTEAPEKLDKPAVIVPLYIAGGVLLGAGIGFTIASDTDIDEQKSSPTPPAAPLTGLGLSAQLHF